MKLTEEDRRAKIAALSCPGRAPLKSPFLEVP